jgi:hypothetical protein
MRARCPRKSPMPNFNAPFGQSQMQSSNFNNNNQGNWQGWGNQPNNQYNQFN